MCASVEPPTAYTHRGNGAQPPIVGQRERAEAVSDDHDGRLVRITLTETGRATVLADRRRRDEWLARRLRDLTPDERDVLRRAAPILESLAQKD